MNWHRVIFYSAMLLYSGTLFGLAITMAVKVWRMK
jgi:hypothetical protein